MMPPPDAPRPTSPPSAALRPLHPASGLFPGPDEILPGDHDEIVQDPERVSVRFAGPPPDNVLDDLVVLPSDRLGALGVTVGHALQPLNDPLRVQRPPPPPPPPFPLIK